MTPAVSLRTWLITSIVVGGFLSFPASATQTAVMRGSPPEPSRPARRVPPRPRPQQPRIELHVFDLPRTSEACPLPKQRRVEDLARATFECLELAWTFWEISAECFDSNDRQVDSAACRRVQHDCDERLLTKASHEFQSAFLADIRDGWLGKKYPVRDDRIFEEIDSSAWCRPSSWKRAVDMHGRRDRIAWRHQHIGNEWTSWYAWAVMVAFECERDLRRRKAQEQRAAGEVAQKEPPIRVPRVEARRAPEPAANREELPRARPVRSSRAVDDEPVETALPAGLDATDEATVAAYRLGEAIGRASMGAPLVPESRAVRATRTRASSDSADAGRIEEMSASLAESSVRLANARVGEGPLSFQASIHFLGFAIGADMNPSDSRPLFGASLGGDVKAVFWQDVPAHRGWETGLELTYGRHGRAGRDGLTTQLPLSSYVRRWTGHKAIGAVTTLDFGLDTVRVGPSLSVGFLEVEAWATGNLLWLPIGGLDGGRLSNVRLQFLGGRGMLALGGELSYLDGVLLFSITLLGMRIPL